MLAEKNIKRSYRHSRKSKRARSNTMIHVTIRNIHGTKSNSRSIPSTIMSVSKLSVSRNLSTSFKNSTSSSQVITQFPVKDTKLDRRNCIYDHHRNNKKKSMCLKNNTRRYACFGKSLLIITFVAISIILPVLLIKKLPNNYLNRSAVLRWNSSGITVVRSLLGPYGFKLDQSGTLYIVEFIGNRIKKWMAGASSGTIIAGPLNGLPGNASNQFSTPIDVIVENNGDMYVTERVNNRLQFWPNGSSSGITVAGTGSNTSLQFSEPAGIVKDSSSTNLYIADLYNYRIVSYPFGSVLAGGNGAGYTNKQLYYPIGLFYDSFSKSFIIPNYGAHNIVQWPLGASGWTLVAGGLNGTKGNSSTLFNGPIGVIMDPMGNVYVADASNDRIQFVLRGQSEGTTIAGVTGISGASATLLSSPYWVQLDNQLNLYVSDTSNGRIQKFLRY